MIHLLRMMRMISTIEDKEERRGEEDVLIESSFLPSPSSSVRQMIKRSRQTLGAHHNRI